MPVYKDSETNTWYSQFYYVDWDGKRKHTTKRGFNRKRDAEEYEAKFKYSKKRENVSLRTLIELYQDNLKKRLLLKTIKPTTVQHYNDMTRQYILPYFDLDQPLSKLNAEQLNEWITNIAQKNSAMTKQNLALSSVRTIKNFLAVLLNFAVKKHFLATSPMLDAEKVAEPKKEPVKVWGQNEYFTFYNSLTQEHHRVIFNIMFFGGLRVGEVLALTPADVNPDNSITVRHTLAIINKQQVLQDAKTKYSVRTVSLPTSVYNQLLDYISRLYKWDPRERIFPYTVSGIESMLRRRIKELNLPKLTPHGLRHSNASILLRYTADVAMVARRLGHKNPRITLETYSHMLPGSEEYGVNVLNEISLEREPKKILTHKPVKI